MPGPGTQPNVSSKLFWASFIGSGYLRKVEVARLSLSDTYPGLFLKNWGNWMFRSWLRIASSLGERDGNLSLMLIVWYLKPWGAKVGGEPFHGASKCCEWPRLSAPVVATSGYSCCFEEERPAPTDSCFMMLGSFWLAWLRSTFGVGMCSWSSGLPLFYVDTNGWDAVWVVWRLESCLGSPTLSWRGIDGLGGTGEHCCCCCWP